MSRRDNLHLSLRRTLEKDGWKITDDPLILVLEQTLLKADLGAEKFLQPKKKGEKLLWKSKTSTSPQSLVNWKKRWDSFSFTNGLWKSKNQNANCF